MPNPTSAQEPWPVRTVARKIAEWISRLGPVWVEGQIAQLTRRPGARTAFLVLRDTEADISLNVTCPIDIVDPAISDGARVVVCAKPDFYPARGALSLRATQIRPVGIGELLARLEHLKKVLAAEGLFRADRKRRPPFLPGCIGLITGRASAAERDVTHNATLRWPAVQFRVENVPVQGAGAVAEIISALRGLDDDPAVDVIVLARGGGSVEDLLPFSDEALCRAVARCRTPVVSAVGHETDSPLVDLVADVRCSTPTDAGKRLVPSLAEEEDRLAQCRARNRRAVLAYLNAQAQRVSALRSRPVLADPTSLVSGRTRDIDELRWRSRTVLGHRLEVAAGELSHSRAQLRAISPAATLARGYAIIQRADGVIVRTAADAPDGSVLAARVMDGTLRVRVEEVADDV
jgi:exodeoxyribonuclease VII large subunit